MNRQGFFFHGRFCFWSEAVPVQEPEAAATRCFLRAACERRDQATDLNGNNDKAVASGSGELWVRLMPFAPRGSGKGINSELGTVPQGEAVCDDFDAPGVSDRDLEIHAGEPDVASEPRAGLAAHTR